MKSILASAILVAVIFCAQSGFAATKALLVKIDVTIDDEKSGRHQTLNTAIAAPLGEISSMGKSSRRIVTKNNTIETSEVEETEVKVTPSLLPEGHANLVIEVLCNSEVVASANVIAELGQQAEVAFFGGETSIKIKVTAKRPEMFRGGNFGSFLK